MTDKGAALAAGIAGFSLAMGVGLVLLRSWDKPAGFGEWSGVVHAAMGIGFFLAAVVYIVHRLIPKRGKEA